MNWLFGKKKPSLEVYVSDETPEGFTRLSTREYEPALPPYPTVPRLDNPAPYPPVPSPYPPSKTPYPPSTIPYSPSQTPYPPASPYQTPKKLADTGSVNPLDSIPFVLAKSLTLGRCKSDSELEPIKQLLNQVRARIDSLYNYDFSLERSVIREHDNKANSYG